MRAIIYPSRAFGTVSAPPSKSVAHRLLIAAGLSDGVSVVHGISDCADVRATADCLSALGVKFDFSGTDVTVFGKSPKNMIVENSLNCCESGSTMRFLIPIALLLNQETVFLGKNSLMARPMTVYRDICDRHGFKFEQSDSGIKVSGKLHGGVFELPGNVSSQFISGLLFALPVADGDSEIVISKPIESLSYIRLTLEALKKFGIKSNFDEQNGVIYVKGNQTYSPANTTVEGDYSGAAFTDALNYLNGKVTVVGLNESTAQGDAVYKKYFQLINDTAPTLDIKDCPDLAPILFALAAAKNGATFTGTKRLKIKESDRATAMQTELSKLGANVKVFENEVRIEPSHLKAPIDKISSYNDHRIVMAMAVLLTTLGGEIDGAEAVAKSYPGFFEDLISLGISVKLYED